MIKMERFIGVNETDRNPSAGQIPYGKNVDMGKGIAEKRRGLQAQITSLGTGGVNGIHTYKRSSGDVLLFGHGTDLYRLSGDSAAYVVTGAPSFNAGTHVNTVFNTTHLELAADTINYYFYNEGLKASDWVEGYSKNTGSQSKQSDHLLIRSEQDADAERTYVTDETVDLTGIDELKIDWEATNNSGSIDNSTFIVSSTKTNSSSFYDARANKNGAFTRETTTLDVSALSGSYYIRVANKLNSSGSVYYIETKVYNIYAVSNHKEEGTWTSPIYDLTVTPSQSILSWVANDDNGIISFAVRGSSDGLIMGDWQPVITSGDSAPLQRYLQVRISLDRTFITSPTVTSFTVSYQSAWTTSTSVQSGLTGNAIRFVDYNDKCYFTEGDTPMVYNGTTVRELGVAPPTTVPTLAEGTTTGLTGTYKYKVTFVNEDGAESNPTSTSASITVSNKKINLSAIPTTTGYNRRLYRTKDGLDVFYFVHEIEDDTTTTYTDTTVDADLTVFMEDTHGVPPSATILYEYRNIMFYVDADNPRRLCFSRVAGYRAGFNAAGLEMVPSTYVKLFPGNIKGLISFGGALIVSGEGFTKAIYGSIFGGVSDNTNIIDIDNMGVTNHEAMRVCVDPQQQTILMIPTNRGVNYITRGLQEQSLEAAPISMSVQHYFDDASNRIRQTSFFHNSKYYIAITHVEAEEAASAINNKVMVYDFRTNQWYPHWTMNIAGFTEANGKLYGGDSSKGMIYEMNSGSSDDGVAIDFIMDVFVNFTQRATIRWIEVEASKDSVPDDMVVYAQVDDNVKTITPGVKDTWYRSNVSRYGQQDSMRCKKQKVGYRGFYYGLRVQDNSTNPLSLYSIITNLYEGVE